MYSQIVRGVSSQLFIRVKLYYVLDPNSIRSSHGLESLLLKGGCDPINVLQQLPIPSLDYPYWVLGRSPVPGPPVPQRHKNSCTGYWKPCTIQAHARSSGIPRVSAVGALCTNVAQGPRANGSFMRLEGEREGDGRKGEREVGRRLPPVAGAGAPPLGWHIGEAVPAHP